VAITNIRNRIAVTASNLIKLIIFMLGIFELNIIVLVFFEQFRKRCLKLLRLYPFHLE
jgi:hypothetical protein